MQWSEEGIKSSYRFIQKLWSLHEKILEKINDNLKDSKSDSLNKLTNKFIDKVSRNLNTFSYNIIIANLHEMYTFLIKEINKDYSKSDLIKNYEKILIVVMPVIPHFSNECLKVISPSKIVNWPTVEERYLVDKEVNIVVQINGKKRQIIKTTKDIPEDNLMGIINNDALLIKYLNNSTIKKKIYVPNRLINIII